MEKSLKTQQYHLLSINLTEITRFKDNFFCQFQCILIYWKSFLSILILSISIQQLLIFFFIPFPTGNRLSWQTLVYLCMYLCIIKNIWEESLLLELPLLVLQQQKHKEKVSVAFAFYSAQSCKTAVAKAREHFFHNASAEDSEY